MERLREMQNQLGLYEGQLQRLRLLEDQRAFVNIGHFSLSADTANGSIKLLPALLGGDLRKQILQQVDDEINTTANQMAIHLRLLAHVAKQTIGELECKYNLSSPPNPTDTSESKSISVPELDSDGMNEQSSTPQVSERSSLDLSDIASDPFYGF
ncbi:MAG: hypothetical protein C0469_07745 [Cyanobacteria bacterium DS2.3.42]|nr:hypothetical protein [Cyanobacteria bacterium DS2.3.42]